MPIVSILCFGLLMQAKSSPPQPVIRRETATVSAGISKKQLDLEEQLQTMLNQAEEKARRADFPEALVGFKKALETVRSEPLLKEQEDKVLAKVSGAYLDAKQPEEAVRSYQALLQLRKDDCLPQSAKAERCGDAQSGLGLALMYSGDFAAAVPVLRASAAAFERAGAGYHFEELKLIQLKQQAEAETLLAAGLARTGQRGEAIETLNKAIERLTLVQRNGNIQESIRESAGVGLKQAEGMRSAIKGQ